MLLGYVTVQTAHCALGSTKAGGETLHYPEETHPAGPIKYTLHGVFPNDYILTLLILQIVGITNLKDGSYCQFACILLAEPCLFETLPPPILMIGEQAEGGKRNILSTDIYIFSPLTADVLSDPSSAGSVLSA